MPANVGKVLVRAIIGMGALAAIVPLRAQPVAEVAPNPPAPRGQVSADCYARVEIWQVGGRTPLRLFYTRVSYNESVSAGVATDLASAWNKFVLLRVAAQPAQASQNQIVYCRYADAETNTELARWPSTAPAPERLDWPGHTIAGEPPRTLEEAKPLAPGPVIPSAPLAAVSATNAAVKSPATTPLAAPATAVTHTMPPAELSDSTAKVRAALPPPPTGGEVPRARDETVQSQQASAVYDQIKRRDDQHLQAEQARNEAYRRQVEEYQQQLAAAQAARNAFEQQQRQYQQDKAAYDAQYNKPTGGK